MKILFFILILIKFSVCQEKLFVCYFTNWAQYRPTIGKYLPENIDPNLCTHIIYAFAKIVDDELIPYEWNDENSEWSKGLYYKTIELKKKNPKLKVLIGVGGWNHGPEPFSKMVHDETLRKNFIRNCIKFMKKNNFDGLDLDWEYPGSREGSQPTDKELFTVLVKELKQSFIPYNYLLTAAVAAGHNNIINAYEIQKLTDDLDFICLMAYDFHGSWEDTVDHNSPLFSRESENGEASYLNVDWAVNYWLESGFPREKFVLGLAMYGRPFKLRDSNLIEPGSPNDGAGTPGIYTREKGFLSYYEICTKIINDGWTRQWSEEQKVPYAYGDNEWVGFEDVESIKIKAKYALEKNLAGVMFWSLSLDDFNGNFCNQGKYPLINAVRNEILNYNKKDQVKNSYTSSNKLKTNEAILKQNNNNNNNNNNLIKKLFVCYFTNWAQYRPTIGKYLPENIDPNLCTHIIYAFAKIVDDELIPYEWNDENSEWSKGLYYKTIELKKKNPKLKVLIGVGGWNHGPEQFSKMVHDETLRKNFIRNCVKFLKKNNFDGLDLDWEYPGSREGSKPTDKQLFTVLIQEFKSAFEPYGYLLTAAVAAGKQNIDNGYEIEEIHKNLDFISLMAYDFHGSWENTIDHNSPLYARASEIGETAYLNTDWAVNYWLNKGLPRNKLVLGLALYGRPFKLNDSNLYEPGDLNNGAGTPGVYTREKGFLSYYEICTKIINDGWTRQWSEEQKVPYAYGDNEWVGFEDVESIKIKAKYALEKNLAGVMFWSLSLDDFNGNFCNQGKYPLINAVRNEIYRGLKSSNQTVIQNTKLIKILTTTKAKTSSKKLGYDLNKDLNLDDRNKQVYKNNIIDEKIPFRCVQDGLFPDKTSNCKAFYQCYRSNTPHEIKARFICPEGTLFNQKFLVCDWESNIIC